MKVKTLVDKVVLSKAGQAVCPPTWRKESMKDEDAEHPCEGCKFFRPPDECVYAGMIKPCEEDEEDF